MKYFLIFVVVFGIAFFLVRLTHQDKKRGCGRGCATCGNREICYRRKKNETGENAQNKG